MELVVQPVKKLAMINATLVLPLTPRLFHLQAPVYVLLNIMIQIPRLV